MNELVTKCDRDFLVYKMNILPSFKIKLWLQNGVSTIIAKGWLCIRLVVQEFTNQV